MDKRVEYLRLQFLLHELDRLIGEGLPYWHPTVQQASKLTFVQAEMMADWKGMMI